MELLSEPSADDGERRVVLTATGPDRPGLTAAIASAVAEAGGNILELGQQADPYLDRYAC